MVDKSMLISILFMIFSLTCPLSAQINDENLIDQNKIDIIKYIAREWVVLGEERRQEAFDTVHSVLQRIYDIKIDSQIVNNALYKAYTKVQIDLEHILISEMYDMFTLNELKAISNFIKSDIGKKYYHFSEKYSKNKDLERVMENVMQYFFEEIGPDIENIKTKLNIKRKKL